MASPQQAHVANSSTGTRSADAAYGTAWAAFLTLVISVPWLSAGFLFGTDWPGPRHFDIPTQISSAAPLEGVLAVVSAGLPAEWIGKLTVVSALFATAFFAYRAAPVEGFIARAAASTLFALNPFIYGRIHYGQLYLLLGYALLPWLAARFRLLMERPSLVSALTAASAFVLEGALSVHLFLVGAALMASGLATFVVMRRAADIKRLGAWVLAFAASTLAGISYWVVPLLAGQGYERQLIGRAGTGDLRAFAAVPDPTLGLIPNLAGLYGFWAEATGRFTSMKAFVPGWPVVLVALLMICAIGSVAALRRRSDSRAAWVVGLIVAAAIALLLEMGYSHPLTRGLVEWLDAVFPPYRGMRDAGKWAAMLALVYSQLVALGVAAILDRLRHLRVSPVKVEWVASAAAGLLLALPLYYGNGLLFGAHGEIKPSQYPAGWYAADALLVADQNHGRALFLPWHEYMSYSFVQNQNRVIASPAPTFFSVPILASTNPEVPGVSPPIDRAQAVVTSLIGAGPHGDWAVSLKELGIKYVLLVRELDWEGYSYLATVSNLSLIGDFGSILVFRNDSFT